MKKYELTENVKEVYGRKLFQIRALKDFSDVKAGDLGGWIEKEENLSQEGNCWVYGDARVCGDARVYGDARVCGDAWVCGDARVCGDAWVYGDARVCGDARVYGDAEVCANARVCADSDYTTIKGFGSEYRNSTFFRCKDGLIRVSCGCFLGTIDEFKEKVKETHGETKLAVEYLKIAELMEYHFKEEGHV